MAVISGQPRVAIVVMPFLGIERPALGPSLLKAELNRRQQPCDLRYGNIEFAHQIGVELYELFIESSPNGLLGEWLFTEALYGPQPALDAAYLEQVARPLVGQGEQNLLWARANATRFIGELATEQSWADYDIIGFSSMFEQQIASLALAQEIKERHPHIQIVFGGANTEGPMGPALCKSFDFVDYVVQGEADFAFADLVEALASGSDPFRVAGVIDRSCTAGLAPEKVEVMDELAEPSFDDFFQAFLLLDKPDDLEPWLSFESSRGCWWGQRSHCTFCGLNGESMAFRSKSQPRVLGELQRLTDASGVRKVQVADAMLDLRYLTGVMPALAALEDPIEMFWEVTPRLSSRQVARLAAAGVKRIQPGIESLSTHSLQIMAKGTKTMTNLQILKWGREHGVMVDWNLLVGFPGERSSEYEAMATLANQLHHLEPPSGCSPLRVDRFSPIFERPGEHGVHTIAPIRAYHYLYPHVDEDTRSDLAYFFEIVASDPGASVEAHRRLEAAVAAWRAGADSGCSLAWQHLPDADLVTVTAHRMGEDEPRLTELRGPAALVFAAADTAASRESLHDVGRGAGLASTRVDELIATWLEQGWFVEVDEEFVHLAVHVPPRLEPTKPRRRIMVTSA